MKHRTDYDKALSVCMGCVIGIIILLIAGSLTSCSTHRQLQTSTTETTTDSVRVEVIRETVFVTDTVTVEIPAAISERTTIDTISTLENQFALSTARINADGTLFHSLLQKPQTLLVEFQKPVINNTTNTTANHEATKTKTIEVPVEVEKELTWWQGFKISAFWYLTALSLVLTLWLILSHRKAITTATTAIIKFVRRIF